MNIALETSDIKRFYLNSMVKENYNIGEVPKWFLFVMGNWLQIWLGRFCFT